MSVVLMFIGSWIGYGPFFCSLLVILLIGYYWTWSRSRFVRLINALPGPDALPFLGNFMDLNVDHDGVFIITLVMLKQSSIWIRFGILFLEYLKIVHFDWIKKYGAIYRLWLGHPAVLISSPEFMEVSSLLVKLIVSNICENNKTYLIRWITNGKI